MTFDGSKFAGGLKSMYGSPMADLRKMRAIASFGMSFRPLSSFIVIFTQPDTGTPATAPQLSPPVLRSTDVTRP